MMDYTLKVRNKLHSAAGVPDATEEDDQDLEESIKEQGVRFPVIVGAGDVILDGRRRYQFAKKHKKAFQVIILSDEKTEKQQIDWIKRWQRGPRQLTPQYLSILRGQSYNATKPKPGRQVKPAESAGLTKSAPKIAQETGVSERTIRIDGKKATHFEHLSDSIKTAIRNGSTKLEEQQMSVLADMSKSDQNVKFNLVRKGGKQWDQVLPRVHRQKRLKPGKTSAVKADSVKLAKSKATKTAEALMRAIDAYDTLKPNKTRHSQCLKLWEEMLATLEGWK